MKNDRSASYYELSDARTISRRLRTGHTHLQGEAKGAPAPYVSLGDPGPVASAVADSRPVPRSAGPAVPMLASGAPPLALRRWAEQMQHAHAGFTELLTGLVPALEAEGAVVMDAHGLVIAATGTMGDPDAESVGVRLMVALEQASHVGAQAAAEPWLAIDLGDVWLSGFGVPWGTEGRLTLGIRSRAPVARPAIAMLLSVFEHTRRDTGV